MRNMNYQCLGCGHKAAKWAGQCHVCKKWNSLEEVGAGSSLKNLQLKPESESKSKPLSISAILGTNNKNNKETHNEDEARLVTGIKEFDRSIGGGIVNGSLSLISGEPGIGKTTLMTQVCLALSARKKRVLYVSGEESAQQVASRFDRVTCMVNSPSPSSSLSSSLALSGSFLNCQESVRILHETQWRNIKEAIVCDRPDFVLIDSIQTTIVTQGGARDLFKVSSRTIAGVSQVKLVVFELMELAKTTNIAIFVIGHINKEGAIAGPKTLEHMVDASLILRMLKNTNKRELFVSKNRFGSNLEIGLFEMSTSGLAEVRPDSHFHITKNSSSGHCVSEIILQGRKLLCQVQCLCVRQSFASSATRVAQGIERGRLITLIAIIEKYLSLKLGDFDIYIEVSSPRYSNQLDLCVVTSILSSYYEKKLPYGYRLNSCEVGLSGLCQGSEQFGDVNNLDKFIRKLP